MNPLIFDSYGEEVDVLRYGSAEDPEPGPGEVTVEVKATSLNFNGIWARRGHPAKVPLTHVSGTDAAAVGDGVTTVRVGDEIVLHAGHSCRRCASCTAGREYFCRDFKLYGFQTGPTRGAHAEYCVIQAAQAVPKSPNTSWEESAALPLAWPRLGVC